MKYDWLLIIIIIIMIINEFRFTLQNYKVTLQLSKAMWSVLGPGNDAGTATALSMTAHPPAGCSKHDIGMIMSSVSPSVMLCTVVLSVRG